MSDDEKNAYKISYETKQKAEKSTHANTSNADGSAFERYAVGVQASGSKTPFVQVVRANSQGRALQVAGVYPDKIDVLNEEADFVDADNASRIRIDFADILQVSTATPVLLMKLEKGMSSEDAINAISRRNSLTLSSKEDIAFVYKSAGIIYSPNGSEKSENLTVSISDNTTKEQAMAIEKTVNKNATVKSMLIEDGQDAALRAAGKATSRFSRKLLLDNLIPKIENPIVQSTARKIVESSWGLSIINISFGYFYPAIEGRIPMSENVRAFGNVVAQHMRRDGLSEVIVDLASEIAGPIKDFLTEQMNMIPKSQLEKILESQKVRAVDEAEIEAPAAIDMAPAASVNGKASSKRQG